MAIPETPDVRDPVSQAAEEPRVAGPYPDIMHALVSGRRLECTCAEAVPTEVTDWTMREHVLIERVRCPVCGRRGTRQWH